jgi:membrane fusion protein (multidrug efflux system)
MNCRGWIGSALLLSTLIGTGASLAAWKHASLEEANVAAAQQPEPMETVTLSRSREREYRPSTTSIGTALALRSITLRNEDPGTVREVMLEPGQVVEAGAVLVALDVSVEEAELRAQQAQAALAQTMLDRVRRLGRTLAVSESEVDRAQAERDVALAQIARVEAIISRKTIRAPFRARVGLADVHPGQYLERGTMLTTLQGVDDAVHVDFSVAQQVAEGLRVGDSVEVYTGVSTPTVARIVAVDARIDPATRNAMVRARIEGATDAPAPGASVRVQIPVGPSRTAVAIPVSALRKGPDGNHVFVIARDPSGNDRAELRRVESGDVLGDEVLVNAGLAPGERVATTGSFKLGDGTLVSVSNAVEQVAACCADAAATAVTLVR